VQAVGNFQQQLGDRAGGVGSGLPAGGAAGALCGVHRDLLYFWACVRAVGEEQLTCRARDGLPVPQGVNWQKPAETECNLLGADGWELAGARAGGGGGTNALIFKRPKR
jgi:hypothetical protein